MYWTGRPDNQDKPEDLPIVFYFVRFFRELKFHEDSICQDRIPYFVFSFSVPYLHLQQRCARHKSFLIRFKCLRLKLLPLASISRKSFSPFISILSILLGFRCPS